MAKRKARTVKLPSGEALPLLGQGTWMMAEGNAPRKEEIAALRLGLDLGMTLIDTAEMYGGGRSEELVGEAIAGRRDEVFLVSKVLPENASRSGTIAACDRSLKRLKTNRLDLYLLHWRGRFPLAETVDAFLTLVESDKIRYWGVSNLDVSEMEELVVLKGGDGVQTNQVLYNLSRRGIEHDLLPWCRERSLPVMAYSPIEQGRLLGKKALAKVAMRHDATPAQIALAWTMRDGDVISIPKAGSQKHVKENRASLDIQLGKQDLVDLDKAFPPPKSAQPLEMI